VFLTKRLQRLSPEDRETLQRAAEILEGLAERGESE
jgi:hypothetical protein